jgi:hypothetical protein
VTERGWRCCLDGGGEVEGWPSFSRGALCSMLSLPFQLSIHSSALQNSLAPEATSTCTIELPRIQRQSARENISAISAKKTKWRLPILSTCVTSKYDRSWN